MSTEYGAEYYSLGTLAQELVLRVVFVEVHGEALLGTYWFIQALFFGYVLIALVYSKIAKMQIHSPGAKAFALFVLSALLISAARTLYPGLKTVCLYRICMGGTFILTGHMIRQKAYTRWQLLLALLAFVSVFFLHPASMKEKSNLLDCISILVSGPCGFLLLLRVSHIIESAKSSIIMAVSNLFSYLGRKSFYIMTFHFLSFKAISLLIVFYYGWGDFSLVGMHPYITAVRGTSWWIAYSVTGVTLSLALHHFISFIYKNMHSIIDQKSKSQGT